MLGLLWEGFGDKRGGLGCGRGARGRGGVRGSGGYVFRLNVMVHFCAFYSLLALKPLSEEKTLDKLNEVCVENHENDAKESLNDASKPDQPLEQATEENHRALKPKMLKFRKVKDGKLSFTGSKNYTKLHQKENKCVHVSPLKFVGNDPDSESQTLRGYLDEECEPAIVRTEQADDCSAVGGSGGDSGQKERGFLASLQEADIDCVAVVCKRTPNIMQNGYQVSDDTAFESGKQEVKDGIDGRYKIHVRPDSKEDEDLNEIKVEIFDTPRKTLDNVSPSMVADSRCKREGEQEQTSPLKSCLDKSHYSEESCNQMETNSISEVENCDPRCTRNEERLGEESCTEAGVSNQGEFAGESNGDLQPVSKIDSGEVQTNAPAACIDEDSSDDFQVSSIRNSQKAPPTCTPQKLSKTKKRKGAKRSKNKAVTREARNHNSSQKVPAEWPCNACTFINDGQLLECTICLTPRVAIEVSSRTPNSADLGSGILISNTCRQSCDSLELVETEGVSKSVNSASNNYGQNDVEGIQDVILERINDGSRQQAAGDDAGKSLVLPHSTPVRLLLDSEEVSTDAPKARPNSATLEEAMAADGSADKGQIAEPGLPPWSCSACTFLNLSQMIECSICLTPRRRSQRLSASKNAQTVERQEKDCLNKNKSNKRSRWGRDSVKKDKNRREMDVDVVSFSVTSIDESSGVSSIPVAHHDETTSVADAEGLTPEPTGSSHDTDSSLEDAGLKEDPGKEGSGVIKSNPRKRLKLEEVKADSDISDEIGDFSNDSNSLDQNGRALTCHSTSSSNTDQKEAAPCTSVDKDPTSSEGCSVSTDDDKVEPKPCRKTDNTLIDKCSFEVCPDKPDVSASSVGSTGGSEEKLAVTSTEVVISDNSLSYQQSGSKVEENLEELKAAAEELFMSEWEDDDSWWEGDSCSGQSSLPSSSETASSSPAVTSPGFSKCSDLYSVTELKRKLETTPGQPKTCATAVVDTAQRFELTSHLESKMPSSQVSPGSFMPETAEVLEEEEEADEPDDVPEAMKLKFCVSLYTDRVYLYDEVSYLTSNSLKYF